MVILKYTRCPQEDQELEVPKGPPEYRLVRPCERYLEMYKSCKSFRGRLSQYYVYGELLDCKSKKEFYTSCMEYRKTKELKLLDDIVKWENDMINLRVRTVYQNTCWKIRKTPPTDYNDPLPSFISQRQSDSLFKKIGETT